MAQLELVWEDPQTNLENLHQAIDTFGVGDLLILPELWACGFSMNPRVFEQCEGVSGFLGKIAGDYGCWLVAGLPEWNQDADQQENRLVLFNRMGQRVDHYAKQKLFTFAGEDKAYAQGKREVVWDIEGFRVAPFICYELRFPELARKRAREADLLIYAANWPKPRISHWDCLLPARAVENQAFAAGVNRVGTDGNGWEFCGHSSFFSPGGECILTAGESQGIFHLEIDKKETSRTRKELPFLQDMD